MEVSEVQRNRATGRLSRQAVKGPTTAESVFALEQQLKLPSPECAKHLSRGMDSEQLRIKGSLGTQGESYRRSCLVDQPRRALHLLVRHQRRIPDNGWCESERLELTGTIREH